MTNLGSLYLQGRGVAQDYTRARELYQRAAERGYAVAQNNLALMYANGQGGEKDYVRAAAWLELAGRRIAASAKLRERMTAQMTTSQIEAARTLARELESGAK